MFFATVNITSLNCWRAQVRLVSLKIWPERGSTFPNPPNG